MPAPRRILVPTDFSIGAKGALRYAADLAGACKSEIVIMHVIEPYVFPLEPRVSQHPDHGAWRDKTQAELTQLGNSVHEETGLPTSTLIRTGRAFQEIIRAAKDSDADLIVMGSASYAAEGAYLAARKHRRARLAQGHVPGAPRARKGQDIG